MRGRAGRDRSAYSWPGTRTRGRQRPPVDADVVQDEHQSPPGIPAEQVVDGQDEWCDRQLLLDSSPGAVGDEPAPQPDVPATSSPTAVPMTSVSRRLVSRIRVATFGFAPFQCIDQLRGQRVSWSVVTQHVSDGLESNVEDVQSIKDCFRGVGRGQISSHLVTAPQSSAHATHGRIVEEVGERVFGGQSYVDAAEQRQRVQRVPAQIEGPRVIAERCHRAGLTIPGGCSIRRAPVRWWGPGDPAVRGHAVVAEPADGSAKRSHIDTCSKRTDQAHWRTDRRRVPKDGRRCEWKSPVSPST